MTERRKSSKDNRKKLFETRPSKRTSLGKRVGGLGVFVQSLKEEDARDCAVGESADSSSRKRARTGLRQQSQMKELFWPNLGEGFHEDRGVHSHQEDADLIEAFSDSGSDDNTDIVVSSKNLTLLSPTFPSIESSFAITPSVRYIQKRDISSECQPTKVSRYASALLKGSASHAPQEEGIDEFESSPSPPQSPLPVVAVASPKRMEQIRTRKRSWAESATLVSVDSSESIDSQFSSPEPTCVNRPKTSEWLKQVGCETPPGTSTSREVRLSDSALVSSTGSERKRKGKHGFKVVPGGLADQLQRLVQRQSAEISFWQHKNRRRTETELSTDNTVLVELLTLANVCSLMVSRCRLLEGADLFKDLPHLTQDFGDDNFLVYFSMDTASDLALTTGCLVRIYSPWQRLLLPMEVDCARFQVVLLCSQFSLLERRPAVGSSPAVICRRRVHWTTPKSLTSPKEYLLESTIKLKSQPKRLFTIGTQQEETISRTSGTVFSASMMALLCLKYRR